MDNSAMKLTAIIPTLNEEHNIEAAIGSVQFADEIIVVDSFSTDRTIEIARKFDCIIVEHPFENYSAQKNFALGLATHDWVLMLDADERISDALRDEMGAILDSGPADVAFYVRRRNFFMGCEIRFSGWQNDKVIRLFRKSKNRYNNKPVHEGVESDGSTGILENELTHYTYKNLDNYIGKLNHYADLQAREFGLKTGRITLYHLLLKPCFRFFRHYILKQGFRDGFPGFAISYLQAYAVFLRYTKMRLLR